jgi:hypothetical protein
MWQPCCALSLPTASSPYLASFPGNLVSNGPANAALVSLVALRWHPCLHYAGGITSNALLSLPALRWRHCPRCMGIFSLVALDLSPTLHPRCRKHCELASALSRCNRDMSAYVALSLCSLSLSKFFVAVTGAVPWQLGLHVQPILRRRFCRRCAGVLAHVALASLQALHCRLCWHCTGIVTNVALASLPSFCWHCPQYCKLASAQPRHSCNTSVCMALLTWSLSLPVASLPYLALFHSDLASDCPADAALASLPVLCWRPWPHCASVIINIALSLLLALCQHHCSCCVGAFALVVLVLLPLSPLCCCQHCKLASSQSQSSCNKRWHHCQHHPIVMPAFCRHHCPCCMGVFALVVLALPPLAHLHCCQHHELASA